MSFKPIQKMMDSENPAVHRFGHYIAYLMRYKTLTMTTLKKEFKGKFKYTVLGYGWHLLTPLIQIIIYYLVFTVVFGRDIPNYWAYVSVGMFAFSFVSSSIVGGSNSIVSNSRMVTKAAFAYEVLVVSKVLTNMLTFVISYSILLILMLIFDVGIGFSVFLTPVYILLLCVFTTGLALLFSALTVYIRDVNNALGLIMGCMMFALPIMYMTTQISSSIMEFIWYVNPLFYFIESLHDVFFWGVMPDPIYLLICIVSSFVVFIVGLYVFKKLEKGFAERL